MWFVALHMHKPKTDKRAVLIILWSRVGIVHKEDQGTWTETTNAFNLISFAFVFTYLCLVLQDIGIFNFWYK